MRHGGKPCRAPLRRAILWGIIDPPVGLGFVISPLWGSSDKPEHYPKCGSFQWILGWLRELFFRLDVHEHRRDAAVFGEDAVFHLVGKGVALAHGHVAARHHVEFHVISES